MLMQHAVCFVLLGLFGVGMGIPSSLKILSVEDSKVVRYDPNNSTTFDIKNLALLSGSIPQTLIADFGCYDPNNGWLHLQTFDEYPQLLIFDTSQLHWSSVGDYGYPDRFLHSIFLHPLAAYNYSSGVSMLLGVSTSGSKPVEIYNIQRNWTSVVVNLTISLSNVTGGLVYGGASLDVARGILYLLAPWRLISVKVSDGTVLSDVSTPSDCFSLSFLTVVSNSGRLYALKSSNNLVTLDPYTGNYQLLYSTIDIAMLTSHSVAPYGGLFIVSTTDGSWYHYEETSFPDLGTLTLLSNSTSVNGSNKKQAIFPQPCGCYDRAGCNMTQSVAFTCQGCLSGFNYHAGKCYGLLIYGVPVRTSVVSSMNISVTRVETDLSFAVGISLSGTASVGSSVTPSTINFAAGQLSKTFSLSVSSSSPGDITLSYIPDNSSNYAATSSVITACSSFFANLNVSSIAVNGSTASVQLCLSSVPDTWFSASLSLSGNATSCHPLDFICASIVTLTSISFAPNLPVCNTILIKSGQYPGILVLNGAVNDVRYGASGVVSIQINVT